MTNEDSTSQISLLLDSAVNLTEKQESKFSQATVRGIATRQLYSWALGHVYVPLEFAYVNKFGNEMVQSFTSA